jgi:PAS domain-containing protein
MSDLTQEPASAAELRRRALARVCGSERAEDAAPNPGRAFGVLYDLAQSPATAADALALLHELQVHQVELDMQGENLRTSRSEMELALARQRQLYDAAPVACFTVERDSAIVDLNLTAARLLGGERAALPGRRLDAFLDRSGSQALHTLLARVADGHADAARSLELGLGGTAARRVAATASADPAGARFLVAFTELGAQPLGGAA